MEVKCRECRFAVQKEEAAAYECHRNPPQIATEEANSYWPVVNSDCWCGGFIDGTIKETVAIGAGPRERQPGVGE